MRAGAGFPFDPELKHDRDFTPSGALTRLSPNLFLFEDTCNVYVVRQGDRAVLIDYGSGAVLDRLPGLGVREVDKVLVTHHHRDQAQGLCDRTDFPFEIVVPGKERHFFQNVEAFWSDVQLYINYNCRSHWNTLRRSIRVDRPAASGDRIAFGDIEFQVLETPGVTEGAVSYVAMIDGRSTAFSGDLLAGPGKIHNWFDLHWDYYGFTQGMEASLESFDRLATVKPDVLLPSHGQPIREPGAAMEANRKIYADLAEMLTPNELHRQRHEVRQILPHLVYIGMNCYGIVSASGRAFVWDYGYVNREMLEEFKRKYGVKQIDAVSFSHYHDDHCIRVHELLPERAKVWVYENMADLFQYPSRYRLPCLLPFPIVPDRVVKNGEKIRWEEYTLEFFHLPGQTEYHQGLAVTIDGRKVLFTGDNTWNKRQPEKTRNGPLVPHNEYFLDGGFITCAQRMLDYMPDLVCPAHTEEYSPSRKDLEEFLGWARRLRSIMGEIIDQPDPNFGVDYRWCHFYPYRTQFDATSSGGDIELRMRNHLFRNAQVEVRLRHPAELACDRPVLTFTVPGKQQAVAVFRIRRTPGAKAGRAVVTADLTVNGHRIGEYAEALVDLH